MNVKGKHYRTIWLHHRFVIEELKTVEDVARAIKDMHVRGAGLVGATAGFGMYLAALSASRTSMQAFMADLKRAGDRLQATRPTAVNLEWATKRQLAVIEPAGPDIEAMIEAALQTAQTIADEDAEYCRRLGEHGKAIINKISAQKGGEPVNVLTHCNAGWLAFVDYGSATAPIYAAHDEGTAVHVWVDETRPRNQGARLTAWELEQHGVAYTVVADNVGGHLMQHGQVDLVITGTDRTLYTGDVANKIGTYLKALAAHDNGIPFYVALPSSSFDWEKRDGVREIPIEQRDATEVKYIQGLYDGEIVQVLLTPAESAAANYAFDVTPARLVTGLITERGLCPATEEGVLSLFPEKRQNKQDLS
jgi:methylthioribose-1-phosphate isomerase